MTQLRLLPVVAAALMAPSALGFVNHPAFPRFASTSSDTSLHISSWGKDGNPYAGGATIERGDIAKNVQAYLKEPDQVEARWVNGTCMVSGMVRNKERTDQSIFDLLNHEDSAFQFEKIVAFVDDVKFAKKRLLSRSARYTGLLDKLDLKQAATPGALPTSADLEGVHSWVACLEVGDNASKLFADIEAIATAAKGAPSLDNVAILVTGANGLDVTASKEAVEKLKGDDSLAYTLVVVGKIEEHPEGREMYNFSDFGTEEGVLADDAVFSREESLRMITELLQLDCGENKALSFREIYETNTTHARLIKGLRSAGYARPQEIDHMINEGPEAYADAVEKWKTENPDAAKGYTTDAWWLEPAFQKSVKARERKEEEKVQEEKDARQEEVEKIATEWVKREFYSATTSAEGTKLTEEEYTKEVWDRALFEGDLKYRQKNGEVNDPDGELADFKTRQARKKEVMLKQAKDDLRAELDKDNLGGDNVPGLDGDAKTDSDDEKMY